MKRHGPHLVRDVRGVQPRSLSLHQLASPLRMKLVLRMFALLMLAAGCSTAPPLQGKPSDTQLSIARARWREHRTVDDFLLIVQNIPAGTPGERVVSD